MAGEAHGADASIRALADECVHCGFCLPACPTYALWAREGDSPRGRIYLSGAMADGEAAVTPGLVGHFDRCLGCMACMPACPSGVRYDQLIEATRAKVEREFRRPAADRLARGAIFAVIPRRGRLRALALAHWASRASGLVTLLRAVGLLRGRLGDLEALAPRASLRELLAGRGPGPRAEGAPRLRVGLLAGCVQDVYFRRVNGAAARALAAEGCEVVYPDGAGCCGALALHAGRDEEAAEAARRMVETFERARVDVVAVTAAGCGSTMAAYGRLLSGDARFASRAEALAAKCRDFSEVLAALEPVAPRAPVPMRAVFLDPCHLRHARGVTAEPRSVLSSIPGVEIVELEDGGACCGSAGIYNLVEPRTAAMLGEAKADRVLAAGADALVTANPGCHVQLEAALRRRGSALRVVSLAELLDESIAAARASARCDGRGPGSRLAHPAGTVESGERGGHRR